MRGGASYLWGMKGWKGIILVTLLLIGPGLFPAASAFSQTQPVFTANCGSTAAYTDKAGVVYQADKNYVGGTPSMTAKAIAGTEEDSLYQTERWGSFYYSIPVANGNYNVTLKFAEISARSGAGKRIFNVKIEGGSVDLLGRLS